MRLTDDRRTDFPPARVPAWPSFIAGAVFLYLLYTCMDERGAGLLPFVILAGYLWLRFDLRAAQSEGFGNDW